MSCISGIANTGQACTELFKVLDYPMVQNTFDSAGNLNTINLETAASDPTYIKGLINHIDPSKRLYPLPKMKNVDVKRESAMTKEWSDKTKSFIEQGIKTFTGIVIDQDGACPKMEGKLNELRGGDKLSVYKVDKSGTLGGAYVLGSENLMRGVQIEKGSIYAVLNDAIDTDVTQINFQFAFSQTEFDKDGIIFLQSENKCPMKNLVGLMDVTMTVVGTPSASQIVVELNTDGGTQVNKTVVTGLDASTAGACFISFNTSTAGKVFDKTLTADNAITVAESPKGTYTLSGTFTSGSTIIVDAVLSGFDFTPITTVAVLIP